MWLINKTDIKAHLCGIALGVGQIVTTHESSQGVVQPENCPRVAINLLYTVGIHTYLTPGLSCLAAGYIGTWEACELPLQLFF